MAVAAALPEILEAGEVAGATGGATAEGGATSGGRFGNFVNGAKKMLPGLGGGGGGQQKYDSGSAINSAASLVHNAESSF